MIDSSGKKIQFKEEQVDAEFLLKEMLFFYKYLRESLNDESAINIAKAINEQLKKGTDIDKIKEPLRFLEEFSINSTNEDLLWELVYTRRTLAKKSDYVENRMISVKHFDKIVKLNPSTHNQCCRVLELLSAVDNVSATTEQREKNINLAKQYLSNIDYECSSIYNKTVRFYFVLKQGSIENGRMKGNMQQLIKEAVDFTRGFIYEDFDANLAAFALTKYYDYISSEDFPYKEEQSYLKDLHKFFTNKYSSLYPDIDLLCNIIFKEEDRLKKKADDEISDLFDSLFEEE